MTPVAPTAARLGSPSYPVDLVDLRAVASVNTPIQSVANGTEWCSLQQDDQATLFALQSILVPTNGMRRFVRGYGTYTFRTTTPLLVNSTPWSLPALDATPGAWISDQALSRVPSYQTRKLDNPLGITGLTTWGIGSGVLEFMTDTDVQRYVQGVGFKTVNTGASSYRIYHFNIDNFLVDRARLTQVSLSILPAVHASLPAALPQFTVIRHATNPWTAASISAPNNLLSSGSFVDNGVTLAQYNVAHKFGGSLDQNNDVDLDNYTYSIVVANEGGTNAIQGLFIGPFEYVQLP